MKLRSIFLIIFAKSFLCQITFDYICKIILGFFYKDPCPLGVL